MREKTLIKNTLIYTIGNFSSKIMSFLLVPFYTHYLTTKDYGFIDIIFSTVSLFIPIITFQLTDGMYRYLLDAEKNQTEITKIISNSFTVILRNLLIVDVIYFILVKFYPIEYAYLIMIYFNILVISNVYLQISRGLKRNLDYALAGIISTSINLASNLLLIIFFGMGVEAILISMVVSNVISILFIEKRLKVIKLIKLKNYDKKLSKTLIFYSIPLIPNLVSWWIMNASDRYFLNINVGLEANGIYAVANKFPTILMIINNIFYLAWQESAITEFNSNDRDQFYTKMFNHFMRFQASCLMILLALTPLLMEYIIDKEFHEAILYMPGLYIASVFSAFSSFYGTGFQSSKETKGAFYSSIFGSLLNIILNILLIPKIGIQGASISTMVAFALMWIIRIVQTRKYFTIKLDSQLLIFLSLIIIVQVYIYYSNISLLMYASVVISLICFVYLNKELLGKLVNSLKSRKIAVGK